LSYHSVPTTLMVAAQKQGAERLNVGQRGIPADVRSMDFLSESMRMRLHHEVCRQHLVHPLFRWWEVVDTDSIQRLCNEGVDRRHLQRNDTLFHAGSTATAAYIVISGELMYSQDRNTARVSSCVQKSAVASDWLCEAVLWSDWIHVGHAEAVCASEIMSVSVEQFKEVAQKSRASMFVFQKYAAAFHARILSAKPPTSTYPTDLEIPCCSFEEIVQSLPLNVRQIISGPALRQLRDSRSRWTRPNLMRDLGQQVEDGKCTLALSADFFIERIVVVVTLKLIQSDGRFLVELLDGKAGSWRVACQLPGTKQREGETPDQTIGRVAATLEPYTAGMVWSSGGCAAERICKNTGANIRSVYFRQTYEARVDPEFQGDEPARVDMEAVPGGLILLTESGKNSPSEVPEEDAVFLQPTLPAEVSVKAYAWLSETEFEYFKTDRGRRYLSTCVDFARAGLDAAVADSQLLHI